MAVIFIFLAAYMTSISIEANAQSAPLQGDAIQLNSNNTAVITGTVISADENFVIINSAGKEMKIVLDRVDLKGEADELLDKGMLVTVDGRMEGDDFGLPVVDAYSITATQPAPVEAR